jgi:hypothetical protein
MTIDERMHALGRSLDDRAGDWDDVVARTGARKRLPRLALVAVLVSALVVPTALALRERVLDFASGDPAPPRIERDVASLNLGIGRMMPDVLEEETRKVIEVPAPRSERRILWVAPRRDGGFCWVVEHVERSGRREAFTSGCGGRAGGRMHASASWHRLPSGMRDIDVTGRVRDRSIRRIDLRSADGTSVELPIVWLSEPIGVGFFLFAVLDQRRPLEVVAFDEDGGVVKRETLRVEP